MQSQYNQMFYSLDLVQLNFQSHTHLSQKEVSKDEQKIIDMGIFMLRSSTVNLCKTILLKKTTKTRQKLRSGVTQHFEG